MRPQTLAVKPVKKRRAEAPHRTGTRPKSAQSRVLHHGPAPRQHLGTFTGSDAAPGHQKCRGIPEEMPLRCCSSPSPEFKKISENGCVQPVCFPGCQRSRSGCFILFSVSSASESRKKQSSDAKMTVGKVKSTEGVKIFGRNPSLDEELPHSPGGTWTCNPWVLLS